MGSGFGPESGGVDNCYVCVSCETGFFVYMCYVSGNKQQDTKTQKSIFIILVL